MKNLFFSLKLLISMFQIRRRLLPKLLQRKRKKKTHIWYWDSEWLLTETFSLPWSSSSLSLPSSWCPSISTSRSMMASNPQSRKCLYSILLVTWDTHQLNAPWCLLELEMMKWLFQFLFNAPLVISVPLINTVSILRPYSPITIAPFQVILLPTMNIVPAFWIEPMLTSKYYLETNLLILQS